MSNSYNQYFNDDKTTLYQKRQYDQSQLQNSTTINSYLGYNQYDVPKSILAFPFFTGSLGNSGPTLFLDGLTPRGSKVYTLLMDVNITSTNPIGILFNIHSSSANVFVIDTVTNVILNTYSLYANASQSYSAIKPVIGSFSVKQEGISSMNDLLGTLLDAIVTTTNFDWTTSKDKPMSTQIGMEHKEGDVDARIGVTCSLLGSPFIPEVYCNNGNVSPIHVNKMFAIQSSSTTVYIKPFSTVHVFNSNTVSQNITLYYDSTGGSTITVATFAISGNGTYMGTFPFPINRIVCTNTPVMVFVDELGELAPVGFVRVSGSNAARTIRLSFRVAAETHPLADKMMDINMFTPDLQFDHEVFRQTMKMARVLVSPTNELVGRAWTWSGLLKSAFEMLKPTLYSLGTKLLEKLKPIGQASTYNSTEEDNDNPKKLVGKAMTNEGRLRSNDAPGYMIIDCYSGSPIITNSIMTVDPVDGSEIALLNKNRIPDFVRSLMVMNNFTLCYVHIGDAVDNFDKSMVRGFAATGRAMMRTGALGSIDSSKIKNIPMKDKNKELYLKAMAMGIDLVNPDFNRNRVAKLTRTSTFPTDSYVFFPAYVEEAKAVDKVAIFLTTRNMKDESRYELVKSERELMVDVEHFENEHRANLLRLASDLFSYAWVCGNFEKDTVSSSMRRFYITFVPQRVDTIQETSYSAALACLFCGIPNGQYITGTVELENNRLKVGQVVSREKLAAATTKFPLMVLNAVDEDNDDERIFAGTSFFHGSQLPNVCSGIYCREWAELYYVCCTPLSYKNYVSTFEHLGLDPLSSVVSKIKDDVKAAMMVDGNLPKEVFSAFIKNIDPSKTETFKDFDDNPYPIIAKLSNYVSPLVPHYGTKIRVKRKFYLALDGLLDYLSKEKEGAGKDVLKILEENRLTLAGIDFFRTASLAGPVGSLLEKEKTTDGVTKSYFHRLLESGIITGEYTKEVFKEYGDTFMTPGDKKALANFYVNLSNEKKIEKYKIMHAYRVSGKVNAKKLENSQALLDELTKKFVKKENYDGQIPYKIKKPTDEERDRDEWLDHQQNFNY